MLSQHYIGYNYCSSMALLYVAMTGLVVTILMKVIDRQTLTRLGFLARPEVAEKDFDEQLPDFMDVL